MPRFAFLSDDEISEPKRKMSGGRRDSNSNSRRNNNNSNNNNMNSSNSNLVMSRNLPSVLSPGLADFAASFPALKTPSNFLSSMARTPQQTTTTTATTTTTTPTTRIADNGDDIRDDYGDMFTASVLLACRGPGDDTWYSLTGQAGRYSLEMQRATGNNDDPVVRRSQTRVLLPTEMQDVLRTDPPLDLLCIEGDGYDTMERTFGNSRDSSNTNNNYNEGPRLCLYARKALFVFQMTTTTQSATQSTTQSTTNAYITYSSLLSQRLIDYSTRIVRVRAAPHRSNGHAYYAPEAAMAVLLANSDGQEYQLLTLAPVPTRNDRTTPLKNRNDVNAHPLDEKNTCRTALLWTTETIDATQILDFDFAKSQGPLALLSSMTVILLRASGDIDAAGPVLWDASICPVTALEQTQRTLRARLGQLDRATQGPQRRQVLAIQRYLVEVFEKHTGQRQAENSPGNIKTTPHRHAFYQANFAATEASTWPTLVQCGVLHADEHADYGADGSLSMATTLQCVPAGDFMGVVVGRRSSRRGPIDASANMDVHVEWGFLSPAVVLPLFGLCEYTDRHAIADQVWKCTKWLERVRLNVPSPATLGSRDSSWETLTLVCEEENLVHVVVPRGVFSISTNVFAVALKQLAAAYDEYLDVPPKRTTAWASYTTDPSLSIRGSALWCAEGDESRFLAIRLSNDNTEIVNVRQLQYRHELDALFPTRVLTATAGMMNAAQTALEQAPAYLETIQPIIQKIHAGLANMQKLVGTNTSYRNMTTEHMAVAVSIKEHADQNVLIPTLELREMTKRRQKAIGSMIEAQQDQLNDLLQQKEDLEVAREQSMARLEQAVANMRILSERSSRVREALLSTAPTMTHAERDFCAFMAQSKTKVGLMDRKVQKLLEKIQASSAAVKENSASVSSELTAGQWSQMRKLNESIGRKMKSTQEKLFATDKELKQLADEADLDLNRTKYY